MKSVYSIFDDRISERYVRWWKILPFQWWKIFMFNNLNSTLIFYVNVQRYGISRVLVRLLSACLSSLQAGRILVVHNGQRFSDESYGERALKGWEKNGGNVREILTVNHAVNWKLVTGLRFEPVWSRRKDFREWFATSRRIASRRKCADKDNRALLMSSRS